MKYLQDLRLLLWLLCRKEYTCHRSLVINSSPGSELVLEARLVSSWTVWTTLERASLDSQAKITCIDRVYLRYLKGLCNKYINEYLELGNILQSNNSLRSLIGLMIWARYLTNDGPSGRFLE